MFFVYPALLGVCEKRREMRKRAKLLYVFCFLFVLCTGRYWTCKYFFLCFLFLCLSCPFVCVWEKRERERESKAVIRFLFCFLFVYVLVGIDLATTSW